MAQVFGREFLHFERQFPFSRVPSVIAKQYLTRYREVRFGYCVGAFQNEFPRIEIWILERRIRTVYRSEWTHNGEKVSERYHEEYTPWASSQGEYILGDGKYIVA